MPKRICNFSGCKEIIPYSETYCFKHKKVIDEAIKERHKDYKSKREDKREQAFYNSAVWKRVKEAVLFRDNYLCQHCLSKGIIIPADVVHHIIELKKDWSKRLRKENLLSLCNSCHNTIHKK